jgi:hypothetical protein
MSFDTQPSPRILTADEIFAAKDIEERVISVPQWPKADGSPGAVRIRTLSQKQSAELRRKAQRINPATKQSELDNEALEQLLFIEGVIEPKFSMADYGRLGDKSMMAMTTVLKAIMDASGFSSESVDEATKSPIEGSLVAVRVHAGEDVGDDEG